MEVDDFCFTLNTTCDTSNPTVASPRFWVARVEQAQGARGYRLRWYREVKPGSRLYRRTNSCFTERAESLTHLTHIRWDAQNNGWLASFPLMLDAAAGSAAASSKARSRKRPRAGSEDGDHSGTGDPNGDYSRYMGVRREPDGRGWSGHLTVPLDPSLSVELTEGLGGGGVAIGGGNTHKRKRYLYPTQLAAAKACDRAALEQWGEDALCNVRTSVVRWYRDGAPRRDRLGKSLGKLLPRGAAERVLAAGCKRPAAAAPDSKGSSVAADGSAAPTESPPATSTSRRDKRARRHRDRVRDDDSAEEAIAMSAEGAPAVDDDAASLALALALSGGYAEPVRRSGRGAGLRATAAIKVAQSTDPAAAILHEGDYLNDKVPKQAPAPAPAPGEEAKSAVAEGNDVAASVLVIREFLSKAGQRPAATWCGPGSSTGASGGSTQVSLPPEASSSDTTDGRNARQSDRRRARSLSSSFTELSESAMASAQVSSQSSRVTRSNRSSRAADDESDDETESTDKEPRRSSPRRRTREKERDVGIEAVSAPRRGPGRPRRSENANSWSQESDSAEPLTRRDMLKEDDTVNGLSPRTQAAVEAAARGNGSPGVRRPSRAAAAAGEEKRREKRGRYGERLDDEDESAAVHEEVAAAKARGEGARRDRRRERDFPGAAESAGSEQAQKAENAPHFRGVRRLGPNRWLARITLGGSQRQLGHFRTEEAAAWAYDAAALRHHGAKARTNFPHKAHDTQSATRAAQRASQAAQAAQAAAAGTADVAVTPVSTASNKPVRAAPVSGISVASRLGRGGAPPRETPPASTQPGQQRRYRGTRQLPDGQWSAYIGVRGHQKTLGKYRTPEEAGAAYDEAALEFHGERAIVNFESSVARYRAQLLNEGEEGGQGGARGGTYAESCSRRRSGRLATGPDSDGTDARRPRGRPRVQVPNRGIGEDSPRTDRSPARSTGYRSSPSSNETPMLSRLEAAVLAKSLAAFGATVQPWPYQLAREEYDHSRHGEAFPVGEMIVDAGLNGTGTGTVGGAGAGAALASAEAAEAARRAAAAAVTAAAEASAEHALQKCLGEGHNGRNAQQSEAQQAAAAARLRTARLMEQAAVAAWRGVSLLPNASITALTSSSSVKGGQNNVEAGGQELWLTSVNAYGREHQVGVFRTAMDAARAHDVVARLLFGARARLNYPWSHYDFLDSHLRMQVNDERRRVRAALKKAVTAAGGSAARLGSLAVVSSPNAAAPTGASRAADKPSVHDPFYWQNSKAGAENVAECGPFYWCRVAKAVAQQRPACLDVPDWAKAIVVRVEKAAPPFPSAALPDRNVPPGRPDSLDIAPGVMRWPRHGLRYQACVKPLVAPPPAARNVAPDEACFVSTTAAAAAAATAPPNSCVLIRGAQWRREHRAPLNRSPTKLLSTGHARTGVSGNGNATSSSDANRVVCSVIDEIVGDVAGEPKNEQKAYVSHAAEAVPLSPASSVISTGTDDEEEVSAAGCEVAKDALRLEWPAQWRAAFAQALQNNGKHFDRIAEELNADERLAPINIAAGGVGGAAAGPRRSERGGSRAASLHDAGDRRQPTPSKASRRLGGSASGNNKDRTKKTVQQCIVFYYLFFKGSRDYHRWKAARAQALREGAEVPGGTQYGWQQSMPQEPLPPLPATVAVTSFEAASAEANATGKRSRSSTSATSRSSGMPTPSPTTSAVAARAALSGAGVKTEPRAAQDVAVEPSRTEREREQRRRQQQERDEEAADEAEEKDAIRSVVREMRLPLTLDDADATEPHEGRGKFMFGDGLGARYTQPKLKAGEDAYCVCEGVGEGWMVACCFGSQCRGHEWYHGVCVGLTKVDLEHNPDFACSACCIAVAEGKCSPPASTAKSAGADKAMELLIAAGRARSPALLYRSAIAKGDSSSRPGRRGGARRRKQATEKRAKALAEARARGVSLDMRKTDALIQQWERDEQQQAAVPFGARSIPIDPMQLDLGLPPEKQPAAVQAVRIAKANAAKQGCAAMPVATQTTSTPVTAIAFAARPNNVPCGPRPVLNRSCECRALPNSQAIVNRSVPSNAIEWQKRAIFAPPAQRSKPSPSPAGALPETPASAPNSASTAASHGPSPVESQPPTPATPNTEALATYAVGDTVEVQSRTWPGINKPGGAGRVVTVNADGTYFIKYVLGGFEKRVEEKYIRPLVPYRSSTPSSVGPSGAATPSSNGAVARGTPSPPAGPSDEVSPEELLSAAGIGPHWLPPLAERRVPLWDETEGLVIIAQNAPKVPEVEEALRRSRLQCRPGEVPLVPFFGALSELAPGGYGPGAGPFAKLYAPSRSRQRKGRGRPCKRDYDSSSSVEREDVGALVAASTDGVQPEDQGSVSWSRPSSSQLLTGMKYQGGDEGSDEEDEEMVDGHVGSISGRRRGIRGSRMHDVPVVNREPKGVKRRRACRRVRRFVRSLPEVIEGMVRARHVAQQNGVDVVRSDVDDSDEGESANAPSWAPRRGAAALREREIEAQAQAQTQVSTQVPDKIGHEPVGSASPGPSEGLKRSLDEVNTGGARGPDTDAKRPRLQVSPSKAPSNAEPFSPLSPSALAAAEHERLRVQHEAQRVRCAERVAQAEARHLERTAKAQQASEQRQRLQAQALSAARDAQMALERHRIAMQEAAAARQLAESLTPRAGNEQRQTGGKEAVLAAVLAAEVQSQNPSVPGTPPPPAAPQ